MTKQTPNQQLNALELFAGAGGLMLGLEDAGFRTVLANEIHKDPCRTLRRNFPDVPILNEPIQGFSGSDLLTESLLRDGEELDLIAGGPPCQGFSTAGLKDPADPRNTLIGEFLRVVSELRPRYFLLENVTGLKTMHSGRLLANVLETIDELNYNFSYEILHAAEFGVPQMRKRLVILGSRDGLVPDFPTPSHRSPDAFTLLTENDPAFVTCGDALEDIPPIPHGTVTFEYERPPCSAYQREMRRGSNALYNHQASKHRQSTIDYYSLVPSGGHWLDIDPTLRKKKQGMQRWPLDGLARTITSEPTDFIHPTLDRIPTIRELARIQSFPDRFEFMGQRTTGNKMRRLGYCAQSQQVGNAVPPLLARAVGRSISLVATKRQILETAA